MRRTEQPRTPEAIAALAAIDATLAGEPVDPECAEVAEVALLIAADRPVPAREFAENLDRRVANRFVPGPSARAQTPSKRRRPKASWVIAPAMALALAGLVALFVVVPGGQDGSSAGSSSAVSAPARAKARAGFRGRSQSRSQNASSPAGTKPVAAPHTFAPAPGLQPPAGRKLIQASQLSLGAPPRRIETVAQEVLNAVGAQNGFVDSATVNATGGPDGYARLQLTVPSANLPQAMTSLSKLPYAQVFARTDKIEDVTGQLQSAKRHHQKGRVRALEHGIDYSKISLDIQADAPASAASHHRRDSGFTIAGAAHDALDVLTVIGGIALIALAVLVPLALAGFIVWQLREAIRRRQRDRALDLA
jgi:hypothetical protein